MKTKPCPHCSLHITMQNYRRHIEKCDGTGTTKYKESQIKQETAYIKEHRSCVCEICLKTFKSKSGLSGHIQRTHTNKREQAEYAKKGNARKREMEATGHRFTFNLSEEAKQHLSKVACSRLQKHSKYSKNVEYRPGVILESSFEVRTAQILDELGIKWIKVRQGYAWDDNGKVRRYIPDFYLPEKNIFLDPKNDYLIKKDQTKIESAMKINNIVVIVLSDEQIEKEFIKKLVL